MGVSQSVTHAITWPPQPMSDRTFHFPLSAPGVSGTPAGRSGTRCWQPASGYRSGLDSDAPLTNSDPLGRRTYLFLRLKSAIVRYRWCVLLKMRNMYILRPR